MNNLDNQQKEMAREALQHFKNGLDAIKGLAAEFTQQPSTNTDEASAKSPLAGGISQIENGLVEVLNHFKSDPNFDPTNELQDSIHNTKTPTGQQAYSDTNFATKTNTNNDTSNTNTNTSDTNTNASGKNTDTK